MNRFHMPAEVLFWAENFLTNLAFMRRIFLMNFQVIRKIVFLRKSFSTKMAQKYSSLVEDLNMQIQSTFWFVWSTTVKKFANVFSTFSFSFKRIVRRWIGPFRYFTGRRFVLRNLFWIWKMKENKIAFSNYCLDFKTFYNQKIC